MPRSRLLIVNADDLGMSPGVNRGIARAHEEGILTSASLMVRWPAAKEAAMYAAVHPALGVGLHFDLGEWICRDGEWSMLYEVVDGSDANAVTNELARQLDAFLELMGRPPTHLDSHQHVHRDEPARDIVRAAGRRLGIPVRHFADGVTYNGGFYGQCDNGAPYSDGISVKGLLSQLSTLPEKITELACHPGFDDGLETMYRTERAVEVATLCDRRIRQTVDQFGIKLGNFSDLVAGPADTWIVRGKATP